MLVSGPLIKPIQDGRKTETRRTAGLKNINLFPDRYTFQNMHTDRSGEVWALFLDEPTGNVVTVKSPYGGKDTTLWVRENWYTHKHRDDQKPRDLPSKEFTKPGYMADGNKPEWAGKTRPAIHIPRWLSRIELTNRVTFPERLQDITQESALAEGMIAAPHRPASSGCKQWKNNSLFRDCYVCSFRVTWMQLNGETGLTWDFNPWVWVVKFTLKTPDNETATR